MACALLKPRKLTIDGKNVPNTYVDEIETTLGVAESDLHSKMAHISTGTILGTLSFVVALIAFYIQYHRKLKIEVEVVDVSWGRGLLLTVTNIRHKENYIDHWAIRGRIPHLTGWGTILSAPQHDGFPAGYAIRSLRKDVPCEIKPGEIIYFEGRLKEITTFLLAYTGQANKLEIGVRDSRGKFHSTTVNLKRLLILADSKSISRP